MHLNVLKLWKFSGLRAAVPNRSTKQRRTKGNNLSLEVSLDAKKKFEKPTELIQNGVIADVTDKGMVTSTYAGKTKTQHKAYFTWILEEKDGEGRNKRVFQSFTVSLHEKATLRKMLKEFGIEVKEGEKFQLESLLNLQRRLILTIEDAKEPGGDPFVKILATQKPSGKPVEIPSDFTRKKDRKEA